MTRDSLTHVHLRVRDGGVARQICACHCRVRDSHGRRHLHMGASRASLPPAGQAYKDAVKNGQWTMNLVGFGKCLPMRIARAALDSSVVGMVEDYQLLVDRRQPLESPASKTSSWEPALANARLAKRRLRRPIVLPR
jgi:hypothetical protein